MLFSLLSIADRAAGDSLDSLHCHNRWKCHSALLYLEEEAEISNDLLCYSAGNHRYCMGGESVPDLHRNH